MAEGDEKSTTVIPPAYVQCEVPQAKSTTTLSSKTLKLLSVYSIAITTVLVVGIIVIAVVYASVLAKSQKDNNELLQHLYEIALDSSSSSQKVGVDTNKQVSVFYPQGPGIPNGTVAAVDYKTSITGIYDPETRECYLTAGLPAGSPDATTFKQELDGAKSQNPAGNTTSFYEKIDNIPVRDHSIIPSPIQGVCTGLPVYWLSKTVEQAPSSNTSISSEDGRSKRAVYTYCTYGYTYYYGYYYCCRSYTCIYLGFGYKYCYYYCYYCRYYRSSYYYYYRCLYY